MRIVIDLQACQTPGSKTRGIGRYSLALAQAMVRQAGQHEIWLLLNGMFQDTILPLRKAFAGFIPDEQIRVWTSTSPMADYDSANTWRRRAGQIVREQALAELRPDIVHVTSLFEGFGDEGVSSICATREHLPTAVTLYDLIPLVHANSYLENPRIRDWYFRNLNALKSADLLLSISEASRREGLTWLHLPEDRIVNISSAVDPRFKPQTVAPATRMEIRQRHGLTRPFVMYTGGIDQRKNIEGLIRAYASLPTPLRMTYQLAIVCSVRQEDKDRLQQLAQRAGMEPHELVMTGFVPDDELPILYNDCALFVFPSWHEGFGLPALEAMACGAPVIAANTSSLPEVIGCEEALFDPHNDDAITAKMHEALKEASFCDRLRVHGLQQATKFSWDASGKKAIEAFEAYHARQRRALVVASDFVPQRKPKLAFVAPLPPVRSGIADYSAELLPELARYYDIELIVDQPEIADSWLKANFAIRDWRWFDANAERFERILYQIGNSAFHGYMFSLMRRHPGVVVLHDFFLSGVLAYLEITGESPGIWTQALYASHGYEALLHRHKHEIDHNPTVMHYPCNLALLNKADGIIVHAQYSLQLARQWYGEIFAEDWALCPLLRRMPVAAIDRESARRKLGFQSGDFIVCSFGMLGPTKLNHRLLNAWLNSPMASDPRCHLIFVGENHGGDYGVELLKIIKTSNCANNIKITGFADADLFRTYLAAANTGVQLRTMSRGETSAAALDCMTYGLPTIVNAHGAMAELPNHAVVKLPDEFSDEALIASLIALWENPQRCQSLGEQATEYMRTRHSPAGVGACYFNAIESFVQTGPRARRRRAIVGISAIEAPVSPTDTDLIGVAQGLAAAHNQIRIRQLLVDVTALSQSVPADEASRGLRKILSGLVTTPPAGYRVEPVVIADDGLRYARHFTCELLGILPCAGSDDIVEACAGDVFARLSSGRLDGDGQAVIEKIEAIGVKIYPTLREILLASVEDKRWLQTLVELSDDSAISAG